MKTAAEINIIATSFALDRETHERALSMLKDEGINFIFLKSYLVNHGYEVKDIGKRYRIRW